MLATPKERQNYAKDFSRAIFASLPLPGRRLWSEMDNPARNPRIRGITGYFYK
jgi:hypothetical protein